MGERFVFTNDILDRAERLKQSQLYATWKDISKQIGCPVSSLKVTLTRRRNGGRKGKRDIWLKERAALEVQIIREGRTQAAVAKDSHITQSAISQRLQRMGLDEEVRYELTGKKVR